MSKKRAFITGITGQDGSYLAELLLAKDYEVHGLIRRSSSSHLFRIEPFIDALVLHQGDLTDSSSLKRIVRLIQPDEIYNLAAMSHVQVSFETPQLTADINAQGTLRLLEAMRLECRKAKFYQASTSELFGKAKEFPQTEKTSFHPRSPYAISKLFAYWSVVNYRESYGLFASNGILFNHESPRRGKDFVTRKISEGVAKIHLGMQKEILLGNLDVQRDWGYAKDYVEGMWHILQHKRADDFVLATGKATTVREFVELCFQAIVKEIIWKGQGIEEVGQDADTGEVLVRVSAKFFRPSEVDVLCGDAQKAKSILGWTPTTTLKELAVMMVEGYIRDFQRGNALCTLPLG